MPCAADSLPRKFTSASRFLIEDNDKRLTHTPNKGKETTMFRTTLLALAASASLFGATEFTSTTAQADTIIRVGNHGRSGVIVVNGHRPAVVYRPAYVPSPGIYYSSPPLLVPPIYGCFDVYVRDCSSAPWTLLGTYNTQSQAYTVMSALQARGIQTYEIRH